MKKMIVLISLIAVNAFANSGADLACVAQRLQALNSDIYYNLSDSEVESMLTIPEMAGHIDAVEMAERCEMSKADGTLSDKGYQCIANKLGMAVDKAQIDSMLTIPEYAGHIDAVKAALACKVY